jgi:hypothetical protein
MAFGFVALLKIKASTKIKYRLVIGEMLGISVVSVIWYEVEVGRPFPLVRMTGCGLTPTTVISSDAKYLLISA